LAAGAKEIGMPEGPKGEKRPADVIGNAVHVMRIATGEIEEELPPDDGKDKAAQALGKKGGAARAAKLTAEQRAEMVRRDLVVDPRQSEGRR
jgi:hypothetical protein